MPGHVTVLRPGGIHPYPQLTTTAVQTRNLKQRLTQCEF